MSMPGLDELLVDTPKLGGTEEIDAIRNFVVELRDDAETFTLLLHQAGEQLAHVQGDTTSRLDALLENQLIPGGSTLYTSSDDAARALRTYSVLIAEVHSAADKLSARTENKLSVIAESGEKIGEICTEIGIPFWFSWDAPPSTVMPEPIDMMNSATSSDSITEVMRALQRRDDCAAIWRRSAREWEDALMETSRLRADWQALIGDRRAAEAQLARTLAGTAVGEIIALAEMTQIPYSEAIATMLSGRSLREFGGVDQRPSSKSTAEVWDGNGPRTSHPGLNALLGTANGSEVWDAPPTSDDVALRWAGMSEEQRETLISEVPWVIGNLPGVPFADRDRSNRLMLEYYITHQGPLGSRAKEALAEVMRIASGAGASMPISIVALDLGDGVPLVALGYGDLDVAEHLTWGVPGMLSDAEDSLESWDFAMRAQYLEQSDLLNADQSGKQVGLIAFLSYDTPNLVTVLGASSAQAGGARLALELDGAFATRAFNVPVERHGAIGHSYGTTTLVEAATLVSHPLDHVTLVASAGIDGGSISSFEELNVARDEAGSPQVFTTIAATDKLAGFGVDLSGRLQPNPSSEREPWNVIGGAYSFSSDGSGDLSAVDGHSVLNSNGTGYFDPRSHANASVAAIAVGLPDAVEGGFSRTYERGDLPHLGPGVFGLMKHMQETNGLR